jgi:hypothetical protein
MNKTDTERFKQLVQALRRSEIARGPYEEAWNEYLALYSNREDGKPSIGCDSRKVNQAFQIVEVMVSAPLDERSKIYAKPRKEEAIPRARLAEKVLALWEDTNRTGTEIELAHLDAAIFGNGWLKTAWVTRQSRRVEPDPVELQNMLDRRTELETQLGVQTLSDQEVSDYLRDLTVQIVENHPLTRRVSNWDIWVDMQAKNMVDIAWIAHRYQRPIEDVKKDPFFNLRNRKNVGKQNLNQEHGRTFGDTQTIGGLEMVEIIEIWDLHNERLYVADYHQLDADSLLYNGDYPYAIGSPFTALPFYPVPDQLYAMGVIELIAPLQQELNDIRDEMTSARRQMKQKFATVRGLLDQDGLDALKSDIDGDVVTVDADVLDGRPLSDLLVPLAGKGVNAELYNQGNLIGNDIHTVTGVTDYQTGKSTGYRSATEVNSINGFTSARLARMIRTVHFARVDVARKEIGLAAQFMDHSEVLRIVGKDKDLMSLPGAFHDGRSTLFPFNRKDIAGDYDIHLDIGTYQPESKEMRLDRLNQVLALAAQFPELDRNRAIEELFKELGFADPESWINPNPTPINGFNQPAGSGSLSVGGGVPPGNASAELNPATKL